MSFPFHSVFSLILIQDQRTAALSESGLTLRLFRESCQHTSDGSTQQESGLTSFYSRGVTISPKCDVTEMKTCAHGTKTDASVVSAEFRLIRFNRMIFQECEETYPETKSGMLQTSRLGIPHMQRRWKQCARAAFTFVRPTWECRRNQAAPSAGTPANHPERNLHGTHESTSTLCCRRSTHLSLQKRRRSRQRRASDATPHHRHVGLRRKTKVPRLSASAAGRVVSQGPPSVSTSAVSPPLLLCCTKCCREGGRRRRGRWAHRWVMRGC